MHLLQSLLEEPFTTWIVTHLVTVLSVALMFMVVSRMLGERRAPGSTFAWLLVILLVPYVGIPLYLVLGGRKLVHRRADDGPEGPHEDADRSGGALSAVERVLRAEGAPGATDGNLLTMLDSGELAFRSLLQLIDGAERSISISTFILSRDDVGSTIVEHLAKRAAAGVEVRLLLDALFAWRAPRGQLKALRKAGGELRYFMPIIHMPFRGQANLRNHRKIVVVDGEHAIVGGMNLASEYMGPTPLAGRWCDLSVRVQGPCVEHIAAVFRSDWSFATGQRLPAPSPDRPAARPGQARILAAGSGPDRSRDTHYDGVLTSFFEARRRIWIATPYFILDETLLRSLLLARRRGVEVRILLPARSNHLLADLAAADALRQLEDAGARICRFTAGMMHAKVTVIDNDMATVGSANLDMRSLFLDYEISLFISSEAEVEKLARWYEARLADCQLGMPAAGAVRRVGEALGRLVAPLI